MHPLARCGRYNPNMNTTETSVYETHLPFEGRRQGKVRDIYQIPPSKGEVGMVLIIASDRISAFDVVMPTSVTGKGRELTRISCKWFDFIRDLGIMNDHLISTEPSDVPNLDESLYDQCEGRMMLGRACEVIPVDGAISNVH